MDNDAFDWIKSYRRMLLWEWSDDPNMFALWNRILLEANYEQTEWHGNTIGRGQLITSLSSLSVRSGISVQTLRTCLRRLSDSKQITCESTNKYTIITVCNYDRYQEKNSQANTQSTDNQQATNKQLTNDQQTTNNTRRNKEIKNINLKKPEVSLSVSEDGQPTQQAAPPVDYEKLVGFFNEKTKGVFGNVCLPLSDKRKGMIRARIREHGKKSFVEVVEKAMASDFLKGQNKHGFKATFDWLIRPQNYEKVLSGNYDNHITSDTSSRDLIGTNFIDRD